MTNIDGKSCPRRFSPGASAIAGADRQTMDDEDDDWEEQDEELDADRDHFALPWDAEDDQEAEPEPGDFWLDRPSENDD
jgi:hypothetical protein